jgi:hypothetical protein
MATTPNFNWSTPDNTGLVKNGALDIRTLGNSIDASMADLKGGTTGQVLAKATNTDMDFTWATPSSGSAQVAGKNGVINGAMDIWQRGTSISLAASTGYASGFVADRYQTGTGANQACTISRQPTNDTTNLPFIQYALRYQRNSGQTGTGGLFLVQSFETTNSIPFAGKTVTFSFYARAGANYSPASSTLTVVLRTGTGTDQNLITTGYTGSTDVVNTTATLTTTWQRFTYSGSIASTVTELGFLFGYNPTGTAGANDWYEVTGIQLEVAGSATAFARNASTIQEELAACQRYYTRLANVGSATEYWFGSGYAGTSTQAQLILPLTSTMRSTTITLDYSGVRLQDYGAGYAVSALIYVSSARNNIVVGATSSGMTANRPMAIDTTTTGYIGISAEL